MTSPLRLLLRRTAGRWLRERPIPVGRLARDRRLLRRALPQQSLGKVLVVGSSLAARQAWPGTSVDVVGTSPYSAHVTVCSPLDGPASLPAARWDTVVVTDVDQGLPERLEVLRPACRPRARLVLMQHDDGTVTGSSAALDQVAVLRQVLRRGNRAMLIAEMST